MQSDVHIPALCCCSLVDSRRIITPTSTSSAHRLKERWSSKLLRSRVLRTSRFKLRSHARRQNNPSSAVRSHSNKSSHCIHTLLHHVGNTIRVAASSDCRSTCCLERMPPVDITSRLALVHASNIYFVMEITTMSHMHTCAVICYVIS